MTTHTTVCIDNDFTTGQPGVGMWPTQNKLACWVDEDVVVVVEELRWNDWANHLFDEVGTNDGVAIGFCSVLCRNENGLQANWLAVFVVERHLGLTVWAQIWNGTRLAHFGEAFCHAMREPNRKRHEVVGLVACVTKHHSLVASTLTVQNIFAAFPLTNFFTGVDTLSNVGALCVEGNHDSACIAIETIESIVVANFIDHCTSNVGNRNVCICRNFTSNDAQARGEQCFTGNTSMGVFGQDGIEHGIGHLVCHFVGVTLGHAL